MRFKEPQIVFMNPELYASFPSVAAITPTKVVVAFREAGEKSVERAKAGNTCHHDRDSRIAIIFSDDGGKTWIPSSKKIVYSGDYAVNDPAISVLKCGDLLLRFTALDVRPSNERAQLQGRFLSHRPELAQISATVGDFWMRSKDDGATWTEPRPVRVEGLAELLSRDPITELEDGTWILPCYESSPFRTERCFLIRSFDEGKNWGEAASIADDPNGIVSSARGIGYNECSVVSLDSSQMLAMIRADASYYSEGEFIPVGGVGELHSSHSENAGMSWSAPQPTGIWGQPAHLLKLANGSILCTYGSRKSPYSVRVVLSKDKGKTWAPKAGLPLREGAKTWDMGYPASAELDDGNIITVYYWNDNDGCRYIESMAWNLKDLGRNAY